MTGGGSTGVRGGITGASDTGEGVVLAGGGGRGGMEGTEEDNEETEEEDGGSTIPTLPTDISCFRGLGFGEPTYFR